MPSKFIDQDEEKQRPDIRQKTLVIVLADGRPHYLSRMNSKIISRKFHSLPVGGSPVAHSPCQPSECHKDNDRRQSKIRISNLVIPYGRSDRAMLGRTISRIIVRVHNVVDRVESGFGCHASRLS